MPPPDTASSTKNIRLRRIVRENSRPQFDVRAARAAGDDDSGAFGRSSTRICVWAISSAAVATASRDAASSPARQPQRSARNTTATSPPPHPPTPHPLYIPNPLPPPPLPL